MNTADTGFAAAPDGPLPGRPARNLAYATRMLAPASDPTATRAKLGSPLAQRLILAIILVSSAITLCLTAAQLYGEYRSGIESIESVLEQVEPVHLKSLSQSLWTTNSTDLRLQLEGMVRVPNIEYAAVREEDRLWSEAGQRVSGRVIERRYPLIYTQRGQTIEIGALTVVAGLDPIYRQIASDTILILAGNAFKTFLVAAFSLLFFHWLVNRHLLTIAAYVRQLDVRKPSPPLVLNRAAAARGDELDDLVAAINLANDNARAALAQMDESAARLTLAIEAAHAGTWEQDLTANNFELSREFIRQLGYQSGEFIENIEEDWKKRLHPEDLEKALEARRQYLDSQMDVFESEHRLLHKDGTYHWFLSRAGAQRDESGRPVRLRGVRIDISERHEAENKLRLRQARIESIFRCSPLGIGSVLNRKLTLANQRICEMLGYSPEEIIGKSTRMLYPSDEIYEQAGRTMHSQLVNFGIGQVETQLRRKDGSVIDALISISSIVTSDPDAEVTTVVQDITEKKNASRALEAAYARLKMLSGKLLETQESERRRLARELHDEIGQALTALKLRLHGLRHDAPGAAAGAQIASCMEIADVALRQVRDMSLNLRPPQLDLMGLESALKWLLSTRIEPLGLKVRLDARLGDAGRSPQIDIACFRVIQEAITNVIRHARATSLEVEIEQDDQSVEITVTDNGAGFDVDTAKIKANTGGSMGLLSMEERLGLLGGSFKLLSSPGAGTSMRGRIPLTLPSPAPIQDPGAPHDG